MSLNVQHGYILKTDNNIFEVSKKIDTIKEKIREEATNAVKNLIISNMIYLIDSKDINLPDERILKHFGKNANGYTVDLLRKSPVVFLNLIFTESILSDKYNTITCDLRISPVNEKILMIVYTNNQRYLDIIESLDFISEYRYIGSTDKPNNLTNEEFDERYNDWKAASKDGAFSANGFSVKIIDEVTFPMVFNYDELYNCTPEPLIFDKSYRAKAIVNYEDVINEYLETSGTEYDIDEIIKVYNTKEFQQISKKHIEKVIPKLRDIVFEDVKKYYNKEN